MIYKTSKDYKRLWELARSGEQVVCFADYDRHDKSLKDVCGARRWLGAIGISARGTTYVSANNEDITAYENPTKSK